MKPVMSLEAAHMLQGGPRGINTMLLLSCNSLFGVDCQLKSSLIHSNWHWYALKFWTEEIWKDDSSLQPQFLPLQAYLFPIRKQEREGSICVQRVQTLWVWWTKTHRCGELNNTSPPQFSAGCSFLLRFACFTVGDRTWVQPWDSI